MNLNHLLRVHGQFYQLSAAQRGDHLASEQRLLDEFRSELPTDPKHPFFYHIFTNTLPPEAAYRLVPHCK
jgi:hypothetical protein